MQSCQAGKSIKLCKSLFLHVRQIRQTLLEQYFNSWFVPILSPQSRGATSNSAPQDSRPVTQEVQLCSFVPSCHRVLLTCTKHEPHCSQNLFAITTILSFTNCKTSTTVAAVCRYCRNIYILVPRQGWSTPLSGIKELLKHPRRNLYMYADDDTLLLAGQILSKAYYCCTQRSPRDPTSIRKMCLNQIEIIFSDTAHQTLDILFLFLSQRLMHNFISNLSKRAQK